MWSLLFKNPSIENVFYYYYYYYFVCCCCFCCYKATKLFCCRIHLLRMLWGCIRTDRNTNQNNILCNSLMEFFSVYVLMCSILKRWYLISARISRLYFKKNKEKKKTHRPRSLTPVFKISLSCSSKAMAMHNNFKMVGDVYINIQFAHTKVSLSLPFSHSLIYPKNLRYFVCSSGFSFQNQKSNNYFSEVALK